ncbi:MAG TPA: HU family DNA-binding protein [Exilispira sp.]|nr:HU family DNA-binding protein [Exilispira sp.]
MKITKKDLIDITYQKTEGINKNIISFIIGQFLNELSAILSKNEEIDVEIRGFGVFKKRKREKVVIQNPKTKEKKIYNNLYSVKFKISKANK